MRIIIESPKGFKYMAQPIKSGLCWELFRENKNYGKKNKNGKIDRLKWRSLERYPADLPYAIECLVKEILLNPEEDAFIQVKAKDVNTAIGQVRSCLTKYLNKLTVTMEKETE